MAKQSPWFDVCIVCALAEEAQAVLDVFSRRSNVKFAKALSPRTQREYRHATITNAEGEALTVHVSWQTAYGPQEAALHMGPILDEYRPRLAVMTGICAGDKTRVKLGDIYGADSFPFTDPLRARCYIAPVVSGSAVRSDDSFQYIREPVRGTMAIDMEGAAFYRTIADFPDIRPLLVKGVCDYVDPVGARDKASMPAASAQAPPQDKEDMANEPALRARPRHSARCFLADVSAASCRSW